MSKEEKNILPSIDSDAAPFEIAVLIPCLNEESTITKVVNDFRFFLPNSKIFVYDNNSTDNTVNVARESGAMVRVESLCGKGNVVRRMFADIEADIYILVDGDDTYNAGSAPEMINLLVNDQLDMVNGARIADDRFSFRHGHLIGNRILSRLIAGIFGKGLSDLFSGYRVFTRRFVKSFPALSMGFEIETEFTIHALELRMRVAEFETPYKARPEGSISKLNTIKDGLKVLRLIISFIKDERPFQFFSMLSIILAIISIILAVPILIEYLESGLVPRFPTAILCSALIILSFLSFYSGLILDTVTIARREMKRLYYLQLPRFRTLDCIVSRKIYRK
jgi:glycosyltransferase involved in cell wall biosynthesis